MARIVLTTQLGKGVMTRKSFRYAAVASMCVSLVSCTSHDEAEPDDACQVIRDREESGLEESLKYALTSTMTGDGQNQFLNVDLDRDDRPDTVIYSCPGGEVMADPCVLTVHYSKSGYAQRMFDIEGRFSLTLHGGEVFVIVGGDQGKLLKLGGDGPEPVCDL